MTLRIALAAALLSVSASLALAAAYGEGELRAAQIQMDAGRPEPAGSKQAATSGWNSMSADLRRALVEVRGWFGGPKPVSPVGTTPGDASGGHPAGARTHNQSLVLGLALVLIGIVILANNLGFVRWDVVWPAVLIAFGVVLLARSATRKS